MKKGIKSYLVFTPAICRLLLFVAAPVLLIGFNVMLALNARRLVSAEEIYLFADLMVFLTAAFLMAADIMLDNWVFGGVAVKGSGSLDCMKASPKGIQLMRTALRTDLIRVFAESAVVVFLSRAAWTVAGNLGGLWNLRGIVMILAMIACQYLVTVVVLLVTRHFGNWAVSMAAVWLVSWTMAPMFLLIRQSSYVMLAVLTVLSVAVSVFSQWKIMRRVEESFYDK